MPISRNAVIMHKNTTYTRVSELGRGSFGCAFKVVDANKKPYCLKEVSLTRMRDREKELARREAQLMKRVAENKNHPNIVSFYDSWSTHTALYILMEYVPGGTLETLLKECREEGQHLDTAQVGHYLVQLASALDYCHNDLRIVHRDIKPANILVDRMGRLKLADFGLSKMLATGDDLTSTFAGSPQFMSPEQLRYRDYSFPTDVWALGCVMYEIMAFRSPWSASQATTCAQLGRYITETKPDFERLKARYPAPLVGHVQWMLRRDPEARPTAEQLVDVLAIREPPANLLATVRRPSPPRACYDDFDRPQDRYAPNYGDNYRTRSPEPFAHEPAPSPAPPATPPPASRPVRSNTVCLHVEGLLRVKEEEPELPEREPYLAAAALKRQQALVDEATAFVEAEHAAAKLQRSFRRRREAPPAPVLETLRPMDRTPPPTHPPAPPATPRNAYASTHEQDLTTSVAKIQRAVRTSLNRRRPPPARPPAPAYRAAPARPAAAKKAVGYGPPRTPRPPVTARVEELAKPRLRRRADLPPVRPGVRPAWQ